MTTRPVLAGLVIPCLLSAGIISDVRASIARGDFARGESQIAEYRKTQGVTPEMLEALSWLGRGALAAKSLDRADAYAADTRRLCLQELKKRPLDADRYLPIALGASIEVQAQVLAARGERSAAVALLNGELTAWRNTSIRTRIQKNLNLLTLEGKPAPPVEGIALERYRGHPVLLFFWAHWCGDCKAEVPALAKIDSLYGPKGLVLAGPTQHYGYVAGGLEATPEQESRYIEEMRRQHYGSLRNMVVTVNEENFKNYGCSTTPTLVLLDAQGIVRLYHPGAMPYEELARRVASVFAQAANRVQP